MEQSQARNTVIVLVGVVLLWTLHWMHVHWVKPSEVRAAGGFSYEMPRPVGEAGRYDLSSREVDREFLENPKIETKAQDVSATKKNDLTKPKVPGKVVWVPQDRNARFDVDVVDTAQNFGKNKVNADNADSGGGISGPVATEKPNSVATGANTAATNPTNTDWKALLTTNPSTANIQAFVAAHASGEISDSNFYPIAFGFLLSGNSQEQNVGSQILNDDDSRSNFVQMAQEYQTATSSGKALLQTLIQGCDVPAKFATLNVALGSGTSAVVAMALPVLSVAVQDAQSQLSTQGSGSRGVAGSTITPQQLNPFVSTLQNLAKSLPADASTAQQLMTEINALSGH